MVLSSKCRLVCYGAPQLLKNFWALISARLRPYSHTKTLLNPLNSQAMQQSDQIQACLPQPCQPFNITPVSVHLSLVIQPLFLDVPAYQTATLPETHLTQGKLAFAPQHMASARHVSYLWVVSKIRVPF